MKRMNLWKRGVGMLMIASLSLSLPGCGEENGGKTGSRLEDDEDDEEEEDRDRTQGNASDRTETQEQSNTSEQNGTQEQGNTTEQTGTQAQGNDAEQTGSQDVQAAMADLMINYAPVLDEYLDILQNGYDYEKGYEYLSTGFHEAIMYRDAEEVAASAGYVFLDISGDDIPELLIGENLEGGVDNVQEGAFIYAAFSCPMGEPIMVLEAWDRSVIYWMGDGSFYYRGSGGASNSSFGVFHMNNDATVQIWDDYYYSLEVNGSIGYYYNQTGVEEPSSSEKMDMDGTAFWDKADSYAWKTINWITFEGM